MLVDLRPARTAALHVRVLQQYLLLLKKYPVLTKSVTSGVLTALGNLLSQTLEARRKASNGSVVSQMDPAGAARYALYGLLVTGPLSHHFYQLMEAWLPPAEPLCALKRLLLDRLLFAPGFLLVFYLVMNVLEVGRPRGQLIVSMGDGNGRRDLEKKMRGSYWTALKMNWKVWTPFQFININFVPVQFRVLFANMVALFWYAYLASVRR
ncbi:Peroxisomal membrane protein 2 [Liparis tanakae]|uniref:Peroxisomal membrane protein 2 n=2 Tax=Liparis tanakae TaxID=230148 RepID=A0A4Z2HX72_9TELE|nr:Peroxisomal membrane protein 2 [Liparis tanakae]